MNARDFRTTGRNALRGHWGMSILVTLVAGLLGASVGGNRLLFSSASSAGGNGSSAMGESIFQPFPPEFTRWLVWFFAVWGSIMLIYAIFVFVMGGAVDLGLRLYNTRLVTAQPQKPFSTLFERFDIFGRALLLQLAMALFIFLWSLLFIIPGIVASYRYAMAPYLMAQNPNLGVMEAIRLSKQMMYGHKSRLFWLHLSFIGWAFLCVLSCGIGFLWLYPYVNASTAAFYVDLANRQQAAAPPMPPPQATPTA